VKAKRHNTAIISMLSTIKSIDFSKRLLSYYYALSKVVTFSITKA
jgi:hypothetical protein